MFLNGHLNNIKEYELKYYTRKISLICYRLLIECLKVLQQAVGYF